MLIKPTDHLIKTTVSGVPSIKHFHSLPAIFTINIENTNDELPFFTDDYTKQQVREEVPGGTLIAKLLVNDYDLDDTIDMTIR